MSADSTLQGLAGGASVIIFCCMYTLRYPTMSLRFRECEIQRPCPLSFSRILLLRISADLYIAPSTQFTQQVSACSLWTCCLQSMATMAVEDCQRDSASIRSGANVKFDRKRRPPHLAVPTSPGSSPSSTSDPDFIFLSQHSQSCISKEHMTVCGILLQSFHAPFPVAENNRMSSKAHHSYSFACFRSCGAGPVESSLICGALSLQVHGP